MRKLFYIEASPRKQRSASIDVAHAFLEEYRKANPKDDVKRLNLWDYLLPRFDGDILDASYAILNGLEHTDEQRAAWAPVEDIIADFKGADKYLFSLPMWNFGIPYKLKHYIDVIVQPGYTFSIDPERGYSGLVTGKPAAVIYARGGAYAPGSETEGLDYQRPYLELVLGFIGFTDIRTVIVEPTFMTPPDQMDAFMEKAREEARKAAAGF